MDWYDKAIDQLEDSLANGEITDAEFQTEMRALNDELQGRAEDAAQTAYNDIAGYW